MQSCNHTPPRLPLPSPQVSVAEERHRALREALEVDMATIGEQADKIKVRPGATGKILTKLHKIRGKQ